MDRINWRYAAGEVLLIFTGITLSLWFNDWSEDNKQRALEIKTLREIKSEILLDTIDINENIRGYQAGLRSDSIVYNLITQHLPDSTISSRHFGNLIGDSDITFHTSAYETLKSRGVETIRDDSLRLAIIRLYDFDYRRIDRWENSEMELGTRDEMLPHFIRHFKLITHLVDGVPQVKIVFKNYQALRNDADFLTVLLFNLHHQSMALGKYIYLREKILALSQAIDEEIKESE